jgi:hypothetical protein
MFSLISFQFKDLMCNLCSPFGHPVMITFFILFLFFNLIMDGIDLNSMPHK